MRRHDQAQEGGTQVLEYKERDALSERILEEIKKDLSVACEKGCVYCCYGVTLWVRLSEARCIVSFANELPIKRRKELSNRLGRYHRIYKKESQQAGYTPEPVVKEGELDIEKLSMIGSLGMNEVPCPFLNTQSGECEIYEARPLMCRLTMSKDKELCKKDWENPISFTWKNEVEPFIDRIKQRFFPRWSIELTRIGADPEEETTMVFLPAIMRLDPLKKVFKLRA